MWQIGFSVISALCGVFSQVLLNFAFDHDDTSKATILRSTEIFFTFILQYFLLNINPNVFNLAGAVMIFLAAAFILSYQMADKKYNSNKNTAEGENKNRSLCHKIFFFKI